MRNVIIFGESGVGKSSLINLIAGQTIAKTSGDAVGCTFQHTSYVVTIRGISYKLWDTAGLDEGAFGSVPAAKAEEQLGLFLQALVAADGVDLLVYCVRGTRLRKALLRNYKIFYGAICRKKVPVAIVVTGLEHHEPEMEDWWTMNNAELKKHGMRFNAHACVTTLSSAMAHSKLRERCERSKTTIHDLIANSVRAEAWKVNEKVWVKKAMLGVSPIFSGKWDTQKMLVPNVVVFD
ncbi:P-loop containing nucleoside triphosphate hydrolase protein, partial [Hygrophoropsis aurantiaca]